MTHTSTLSSSERERYSRHLMLPEIGIAGQEKLKAARVLVVGAGGLGSPASLYLAAAGVGTLGIVDHDRVDLSNLQRQLLFDTASVGTAKALSAQTRLTALNTEIRVIAHDLELRADNALSLLGDYDVILDGSDRLSTRYLVNDACVLLKRPLVSAAIHRFEGQAMTYVPGAAPCYRCLFPQAEEAIVPNCATAGVLGVLPGMLGTVQAAEAIKLILHLGSPLTGRLLTFDALSMQWREFRFARRADCAVCGTRPTITSLQTTASVLPRPDQRWSPRQLRERLDQAAAANSALALIDVREPREFALAHLAGATNIPLAQLPHRLSELASRRSVVFMCRSGGRSRAAWELAARSGHTDIADLEGGLLGWAATIDPTFSVAPFE